MKMELTEIEIQYITLLIDTDIEVYTGQLIEKARGRDYESLYAITSTLKTIKGIRDKFSAECPPLSDTLKASEQPKPQTSRKKPGRKPGRKPAHKPEEQSDGKIADTKDRLNDADFITWVKAKGLDPSYMEKENLQLEYEIWISTQNDGVRPHERTDGKKLGHICKNCCFYRDGRCFDTKFIVEDNFTCEMFEKKDMRGVK